MRKLEGLARAQRLLHCAQDTLELLSNAEDITQLGTILLLEMVLEEVNDILEPFVTRERGRQARTMADVVLATEAGA